MNEADLPKIDTQTPTSGHRCRRGFTMIELLVVIGLITVIISMLIAAIVHAKSSANSLNCLNSLRHISGGLRSFASDHNNRFPDPAAVNLSWEAMVKPYLPEKSMFICSADFEIGPTTGSSYDWRDTGDPETTLAGRSLNSVGRNLILAMEALPGWHQARMVNVGRMDGSVAPISDQELIGDLMSPVH